MSVLLSTRLLRGAACVVRKLVINISWVAEVIPIDRHMSVRNRCVIEIIINLSTNSGDSYWHKLCSTHSGFVFILI